MSLTSDAHKTELRRFADLLSHEAYQTQLAPVAGAVPYDTLIVRLESFAAENRIWYLELSYLPGLEDDLDDVSILQVYVALTDQIAVENRAELEHLMVKLNAKLPIGCFGLLDSPMVLFFKHNVMLPDDNHTGSYKIVRELISLTTYLIGAFSQPLIKMAAGVTTGENARN
jgi:hypothetical protein